MKHKKLTIALVASMVATILMVATLSVYAYFTTRVYVYTEDGKEVAHVGMNLQLLFGKLSGVEAGTDLKIPSYNVVDASGAIVFSDNTTTSNDTTNKGVWANTAGTGQYLHYNDGVNDKTTYDPDAPWGSAQNPYIISETRHLQNLSALQSVGYFDLLYVANNFDADGNYIEGSASIPYFLICTDTTSTTGAVAGRPVTIDGSALDSPIKPIGSAEHPFIGVIGGAFNTTDSPSTTVAGKTSSVSTIHGFDIQTNTNQTDVGLFGYVGFLGVEPQTTTQSQFAGAVSSIQDLLISDVQVIVKKPSLIENISELFGPLWAVFEDGHRYSYTHKIPEEGKTLPEETHHIGIFAGHVSYATIDGISVYYSNDTIKAIDLLSAAETDNYYSVSGILGMFYNMNCEVENVTTTSGQTVTPSGNCVIMMGTGSTADEIGDAIAGSGSGTGGGQYSGNGRGYVTAAEIFTTFNNVYTTKENEELLWRYKDAHGAWVENVILVLEKVTDAGTTYMFVDGTTAYVSDDKTSVKDGTGTGANSWNKFVIRKVVNSTGEAGQERFEYVTQTGEKATDLEMIGNKYNGQVLWKYCAGGDNIWHYGIRVYKNGTNYTLEDGTGVTYDVANNQIVNGTTTWQSFFISDQTAGATMPHYIYDPVSNKNWTVSSFERKPLPLIKAYGENIETSTMELLCKEAGDNLYYFYDGVFTFGLSSANDTVRDTWKNDTTPDLYLGPNSTNSWEVNQDRRENRSLVALLKPVTSNEQLNQAILEGKQFYISAQPDESDASKQYFMSLLAGSTPVEGKYMPNDVPSTPVVMDDTMQNLLMTYYKNGTYKSLPTVPLTNADGSTYEVPMYKTTTDDLYNVSDLGKESFWKDAEGNNIYTVLNIGRTSTGDNGVTLQDLKESYNIVPSNVTEGGQTKYYYYRNDTGAYVGTGTGDVLPEMPAYYGYDEYIYYTVSYEVPGVKGDESNKFGVTRTRVGNSNRYTYEWNGQGWTYGQDSHTAYERVRIYTFTFYYQGKGGTPPVSLGTTSVTIIGRDSNGGTSRMPAFEYGMVYYGQQSNYNPDGLGQTYPGQEGGGGGYVNASTFFDNSVYDDPTSTLIATITRTNTTENGGVRLFDISTSTTSTIKINATGIPMINLSANRFHGETGVAESGSKAVIMSAGHASVEVDEAVTYYYRDVASGNDAFFTSDGKPVSNTNQPSEGAILLNRYPAYTFGSNTTTASRSYLQLLHQFRGENYWYGQTGDVFSLWSGTNVNYGNVNDKPKDNDNGNDNGFEGLWMAKGHTTEAVLIFESDGTCYIQYTYDSDAYNYWGGIGRGNNIRENQVPQNIPKTHHTLTRYVSYEAISGGYNFSLSETKKNLYVYVIEGVIDAASGVNTFKPTANSDSHVLDGDQFVFWPQTTLTQGGYKTNTGYDSTTKKVTGEETVTSTTLNAKLNSTADPVYKVIPLVGTGGLNWGDDEGYKLGDMTDGDAHGLDKKFQASAQSFFGGVTVENGNFSDVFSSNLMVAPVGSNNVDSLLPKGSVAFRVNAEGTQTIRIIVAIPTTTKYLNETKFHETMDLVNDYYVGVWKLPEIVEGGEYTFSLAGAVEKFELPRSYAFASDASPTTVDANGVHYTIVEYDANKNGTIEESERFRTYLNGDTFLVAYQFTIQGSDENAGTYVIGNAHVSSGYASADVPMEIVHFSVSGTASAGRDGVAGNQLGAIDFVYDDAITTGTGETATTTNTIITVDRVSGFTGGTANTTNGENYANYYASQCLLYTNTEKTVSGGGFIKINQVRLYVRRRVNETVATDGTVIYDTVLTYYVGSEDTNQTDAFTVRRYLMGGDTPERLTEEPGTNTSGGTTP